MGTGSGVREPAREDVGRGAGAASPRGVLGSCPQNYLWKLEVKSGLIIR